MYAIFKTLVAYGVPVPLCLGVFVIGVLLLWVKRTENIGRILVTLGVAFLVVFSFPFLPNLLLNHIERQYSTPKIGPNNKNGFSEIRHVVVLAGGHISDSRIPITGQFSYEGLVRLIEGIRLYRKCPGTKLVLSGGKGRHTHVSDAELMRDLAMELGVTKDDIILETKSQSTADEARLLKPILVDEKFLLVTSASHMPRSMGLFRRMGMNPIAAPTGHLVKRYGENRSWMPSVSNLKKSETAFYEMLATLKGKILGGI